MIKQKEVFVLVTVDVNDGYVESSVYATMDMAVEMVKGLVEEGSDENGDELEATLKCVEMDIMNTHQYKGDSTVYHVFKRSVNGM